MFSKRDQPRNVSQCDVLVHLIFCYIWTHVYASLLSYHVKPLVTRPDCDVWLSIETIFFINSSMLLSLSLSYIVEIHGGIK